MASINKLSIRGVRSFSPDDAEQVLEFYFPCTIIVGANGCGKTTIIESLKFAVAGAMPPGNKSGQAFVHDPRSLNRSTVKANVKLRFTGRAGNQMVVVRSMEVNQKKTTMSFKQLDGTLRSQDRDGNRVSMGHKCSELDRQLPLLLGVSKAILDHVVFCHQEDASWPLQEGAVLKKRFDDIFDSTRYSKALKVYADLKKQYASQAKDLKIDQASIASHQHAAKGFRLELSQFNSQMEALEEEIQEQKEAEKEIKDEEHRLNEIMKTVDSVEVRISASHTELTEQKTKLQTMLGMIKSDLTRLHSVNELKEMLRDFDNKRNQQAEQKEDLERELTVLHSDHKRIQNQQSTLQADFGRLTAMKEAHQERLKARFQKMMHLGNTYALADALTAITQSQHTQTQNTSTGGDGSRLDMTMADQEDLEPVLDIPQSDMDDFSRAVERKEAELRDALKECKARHQHGEDDIMAKITRIRSDIGTLKSRRAELNSKSAKARDTIKTLNTELGQVPRLRRSDLEEARQKAAQFDREAKQVTSDPRKSEIEIDIRDSQDKLDKLKRDLDDDKIALRELQQSSDSQQAINVLRQQISQEVLNLEEVLRDHAFEAQSFNLSSFPKDLPSLDAMGEDGSGLTDMISRFVDEVTSRHEARKLELERSNMDVKKIEAIVSERKGALNNDQNSLKEKRLKLEQLEGPGGSLHVMGAVFEELKTHERKIGEAIPDTIDETRPLELLEYLNTRVNELDAESLDGITPETIKKILRKLWSLGNKENGDFDCPCCHRALLFQDEEDEYKKAKTNFKLLYSSESPLLQGTEESKVTRDKYAGWRDTVSARCHDVLEYRRLANEVKSLENKVGEMEEKLLDSCRQLQNDKSTAEDLVEEVDKLRSLLNSANHWAEDARKIATKRTQVKEKEIDFAISGGVDTRGRDLQTLQREMDQRQEEREQLNTKVGRLNKELSALMTRISHVNGQAQRTHQLWKEKEKKYEEVEAKFEQKKELTELLDDCVQKDAKLQDELAPLEQKEKTRELEKQRLRKMNEEEHERNSETLSNFLKLASELKDLVAKVKQYEASTNEDELASVACRSETFSKKLEEKLKEIARIKPVLQQVEKAIEDHEAFKKNLKDNLDIIYTTQRIEKLEKEVASMKIERTSIEGHETVYDDFETLRHRQTTTGKAIARLEGRRGEILESIRSVKRKLSSPEYKNVDEEYRVATIKLETTQLAVKDLEKYHNALDKALLKFHSLKIAEINKIIRDLWTLTYKGEDITSIKIVSGQESESKASRSYNYRVVMNKGSTELDMRGRCSAGQRVLASIVIRLALAETFCLNFGCIALDEPTVNLDLENRKGLAVALAQIIGSRAKQSNFQLIMITHDQDFVSMMKTELTSQSGFDLPEKYFLVRREEGTDGKFYSKIDAIDWEEL